MLFGLLYSEFDIEMWLIHLSKNRRMRDLFSRWANFVEVQMNHFLVAAL